MSATPSAPDVDALRAYEQMAPIYDAFTAHHRHELWTEMLVELLAGHGLPRRGRVLDVGCGTGKSFLPWEAREWDVVACDASPAMVRHSRAKAAATTRTLVADARRLPVLGRFDLVALVDDVVNYLAPGELASTFTGAARNLASGGLLAFDVNTLCAYRTFFATTEVCDAEGCFAVWRGAASGTFGPGDVADASVDGFVEGAPGRWRRVQALHRQYHHPVAALVDGLHAAGLTVCAVHGIDDDCDHAELDELRHPKALVIARRPGRESGA